MDTAPRSLSVEELDLLHDMARRLQNTLSHRTEVSPPPGAGPTAQPPAQDAGPLLGPAMA
ncbi:hypothetical protein D3C81_2298530 [compost metagenome]